MRVPADQLTALSLLELQQDRGTSQRLPVTCTFNHYLEICAVRAGIVRRVTVAHRRERLKTSNGTSECIGASAGGRGRKPGDPGYQCHYFNSMVRFPALMRKMSPDAIALDASSAPTNNLPPVDASATKACHGGGYAA